MKLITAIAALALVAGSMDVEAQKRGKVGKPGDSDDDAPQISGSAIAPANVHGTTAHLAIGVFGELDAEARRDLAEAAEEGDEEALEELRSERVEAIETLIEALGDKESRELIMIGMMIERGLVAGGTLSQTTTVNLTANPNLGGQYGFDVDGCTREDVGEAMSLEIKYGDVGRLDGWIASNTCKMENTLDMVLEQLDADREAFSAADGAVGK